MSVSEPPLLVAVDRASEYCSQAVNEWTTEGGQSAHHFHSILGWDGYIIHHTLRSFGGVGNPHPTTYLLTFRRWSTRYPSRDCLD